MSFPRMSQSWWIVLMILTSVPALGDDFLPKAPGSYERVLQTDGFDLRFGVEVPEAGKGSGPKPLILALHYGFDSSRPFPEHYGKAFMDRVVSPGFTDLGAFIVAPDSHGRHWADADIGKAVLALLDRLTADPRIDASKVIVTGYSMGGAGAWFFASQHTDRFCRCGPYGRPITIGMAEPNRRSPGPRAAQRRRRADLGLTSA